ncbi:hypothetical protein L9W92_05195 [Pelotomaculum terephthalicicum JT]|uniref:hypothetical protein n=1 Tax=Pelotomaculum terephthalicicum TaxID=206393 RepID=UPI001F04426E|nr:hypothetical protein [Pelotomaculum terephthalicicum]MCG9967451.1 hypothetical protein [Pelotomaculum terephthalicicum JT]
MTNEALSELLDKQNLVMGHVYLYDGSRQEYLFEHSPFKMPAKKCIIKSTGSEADAKSH